jgi:hypothetical protein
LRFCVDAGTNSFDTWFTDATESSDTRAADSDGDASSSIDCEKPLKVDSFRYEVASNLGPKLDRLREPEIFE